MTPQDAVDEVDIRRRIDRLVEAIRAMDLEGVKALFAPDIVSFDVGPPLQKVGVEGKMKNWRDVFEAFQPPLGYEIRDLTITSGGEAAFARGFARLSGTLKNGSTSGGFWVRYTACFRKLGGEWLIAHDHVSAPLDVESGRALLTLEP